MDGRRATADLGFAIGHSEPEHLLPSIMANLMRMSRAWSGTLGRPAAVAMAAYCLFALALFWPALSGQRVFSAASDLYLWPPWATVRPSGLGGYTNRLLSDHTLSFYPWLHWARAELHAGHFPQWNPLTLSGTPFLANAQAQLLSPFSLPLWLAPFQYALGVAAALKLVVAAFGGYLLGRELDLRPVAAFVSGLAWGFCPFLVIFLSHPVTPVVAMFPWVVLFAERTLRRTLHRDLVGLSVACAVAFLAGYPESQAHLVLGLAMYAILRAATIREVARRRKIGRLARVGLGVVLGAMLAAVALVPVALGIPGTAGVAVRSGGGASQPFSALLTVFFPDWWGRPSGVSVGGPSHYNFRTFYLGTLPVLLAAVAVFDRSLIRRTLPLIVLAFVGIAVPTGLEPLHWLLVHTPPFDHSLNQLMVMFADFAIAMLAGFGLEGLMNSADNPRRAKFAAIGGLVVAVLGVVAVMPGPGDLGAAAHHFLTGADLHGAKRLALVSIVWWLLIALPFALVVALRSKLAASAVAAICIGLSVVDAGHFFYGYQPMAPPDRVFASTPAIRFLQSHQGGWRIAALAPALPADVGMVYGLRDVRGLDPPQPTTTYAELMNLGGHGKLKSRVYIRRVSSARAHVLDLLSVRFILASSNSADTPPPGYRLVYHGADATVFENSNAVSRVSVPTHVRLLPDGAARAAIASNAFDPAQDAIVASRANAGQGSATLVSDSGETVTIAADMKTSGLVVLADQWTPGWTVTVDGHPATAVRVDTATKGVMVPSGSHRVIWTFTTPGLTLGVALMGLAVLALCAWPSARVWRRVAARNKLASTAERGPG
jgi:hypothetical protein